MQQIRSVNLSDASMYFNSVVAINKVTGAAAEISVVAPDIVREYRTIARDCYDDGDIRRRHWYAGIADQLGGGMSRIITPEQLDDEFCLSKFPLGWMNCTGGAFYLSGNSDRSARKGHRQERIKVESMYYHALNKDYSKMCVQYDRRGESDAAAREALEQKLTQVYEIMRRARQRLTARTCIPTIEGTLGQPLYPDFDEAKAQLVTPNPEVNSRALSREFALSLCNEFHTTSVGLYFHTKLVGYVNEEGLYVFNAFAGLLPQIKRTLNIEGEVS